MSKQSGKSLMNRSLVIGTLLFLNGLAWLAGSPAGATGTGTGGPYGSTFDFELLAAEHSSAVGSYYRLSTGPGSFTLQFDGIPASLPSYCCGLDTTPSVNESFTANGDGTSTVEIIATSPNGTDLYPSGMLGQGNVPETDAGLRIGHPHGFFSDSIPLAWNPPHTVLSATVDLKLSNGTSVYGGPVALSPGPFFGAPGPWDGSLAVVFPNQVGKGVTTVDLRVVVPTPDSGGAGCVADTTTLCLSTGRFKVKVAWQALHLGTSGTGQAVPLTSDTGYFWFFGSSNVELVIKVVDGTPVNGHFWVFYGALSNVQYTITVTDTKTGLSKTYFNPQDTLASVADTSAFSASSAAPIKTGTMSVPTASARELLASAAPRIEPAATARLASGCTADATTLCLSSGRFKVKVAWQAVHLGTSGTGQAVPLTSDTGYFWFFGSSNVELVIKVVDGTPVNGKFWVFYGALSNVQYTITVTDMETGAVVGYSNPSDHLASVADTSAFGKLLETASTLVSAVAGGTLTLPSGSSILFPPSFVSGDREVTLSLVSSLAAMPPSGLVRSMGPGLVLSFSPPLSAVPFSARTGLGTASTSTTDIQFSINIGAGAPVGAVDSAPMADFVDLEGKSQFVGVPGEYDPTQRTATGTTPILRSSDVGSIQISLAQVRPAVELAPLPRQGAKIWNGTGWIDGTPGFDPAKRTLVLVHGMASKVEAAFGDCKDGAGSAAEQIRKAGGYEQIIGFDYDWTQGLAANGKNLADFLDSLQAAGLVTVDLEGHSEGVPVLLSAACQTHVTLGNVAMLGGPIMGTPAASVGSAVQTGGINALETVLLNLYGPLAPPVGPLGGILSRQFASDLQPGNTGTLASIRGCIASKMTDSSSNLGNTKLIAAAGYDFENDLGIGALGTVFKFFGLFGSEPFDGIVGLYSALGVGSGLDITRLSPYPLSHTRLECDSNVIRDVGSQVGGSGGGCAYKISPTSQSFGASGSSRSSVMVAAASGCKWTAVSNASWITITSVSSPSGNGTVDFSVDANPGTSPRTGTMVIAGLTFTVTEDGAAPSQCNTQQVSGRDTPETLTIEMGKSSGTFTFDYNTYEVPDRMEVFYEGRILFDTGCVRGPGSLALTYSGISTVITVQVTPNCSGTESTGWDFTVNCPT
jgi:Viral BACON domain